LSNNLALTSSKYTHIPETSTTMILPAALILAFQAAIGLAVALPAAVEPRAPTQEDFEAGVLEHVLFERDATLSARDLEIADRNGVNLTESMSYFCPGGLRVGGTNVDAV